MFNETNDRDMQDCNHHWEWFAELGTSTEEDGSRVGLWEMICTGCDRIVYEEINYDHEA